MKITKKLAERLEGLLQQAGFKIRYEKGNFKGGVCLLEAQKMVIVNKFYPFESRVATLMDIIGVTPEFQDITLFDEDDRKLITDLRKHLKNSSKIVTQVSLLELEEYDGSEKSIPLENPQPVQLIVNSVEESIQEGMQIVTPEKNTNSNVKPIQYLRKNLSKTEILTTENAVSG